MDISSKFPIGVATIYKAPNLVFLGIVSYFYKFLIISANLFLFISCSTNIPNNTFDSNKVISIDKPKVTYEVKKLPKSINIFLLDTKGIKEKEFINGFSTNYYYFREQINYSPDINFITREELGKKNCSLNVKNNDYSIIFLTDAFLKNLKPSCLTKILKLKAFLINSNNYPYIDKKTQVVLHFNKKKEYEDLLKYAKTNGSRNALIIDGLDTSDKHILNEIWLELEGNVLDSSTSNGMSNQNLLSNILLLESSKERVRKLSRALSSPLESNPRRRMDVDSIIMSVSLREARSLKPELEYNFGEDLSVYLFPNWKDQSFYLDKELDLERVSIIDLPWMFNSEISYLRNLPKKRNRYFAFGYDSYDIALLLNNPSSTRQFKYTGMSGELSYKNGILSRKSLKTEISEGLFKAIGY